MLTLFSEKYIYTLMSYLTTIIQIFRPWVDIISKCWHVNKPSQPKDYHSQDHYHHNRVNMWRHFLNLSTKITRRLRTQKSLPIYIFISEETNFYTNQVTDLYQFHTKRTNEPTNYNVVVLVMWEAPGLETIFTDSRHYIIKCVLTWENLVHV